MTELRERIAAHRPTYSLDCVRCGAELDEADMHTGAVVEWKTGLLVPLQGAPSGAGRRDLLCAGCGQAFRDFLLGTTRR